jgi:integrase/recombinase XerD
MQVRHLSSATIALRRSYLARFLAWCDERSVTTLDEITRDVVQSYQRYLFHYRNPKTGAPLRFTTQVTLLLPIRSWFSFLIRERVTDCNPAQDLDLPKEPQRLPTCVLTVEEVQRILNVPDVKTALGLRDRAMLETLYSTAMRRGELIGLDVYDLDRERGVITIRHGKGDKTRNVPIGQRALDWLVAYIERARPALVEQSTTQRIFVSFSGKPFGDNCLSNLVTSFIQRAGIAKPGSCHLFRHSAATWMMENGADLRSLQTLLGHASLNTTQIYTHVSIQHLKDVHDKTHPGNLPFKDSGSDSAETTE